MDISLEFRKKMIAALLDALQESPLFVNIDLTQLRCAVMNSENLTYHNSKNHEEYTYLIYEKLKKIKNITKQKMDMRSEGETGYGADNIYSYERGGGRKINPETGYGKGYNDIPEGDYMAYGGRMGPMGQMGSMNGSVFMSPRSGGYGPGLGEMRYNRGEQMGRYGYMKDRENEYRGHGMRQREWPVNYYNSGEKEIDENEDTRRGINMVNSRIEDEFYNGKEGGYDRIRGGPLEVNEALGYEERNMIRGEMRYGIVGDMRHSRTPEMRQTKSSGKMRYTNTPEMGCTGSYRPEIIDKPRSPYVQDRRVDPVDGYKVSEQTIGDFQRKSNKQQFMGFEGGKGVQNMFNLPIFNDYSQIQGKRKQESTPRQNFARDTSRGPSNVYEPSNNSSASINIGNGIYTNNMQRGKVFENNSTGTVNSQRGNGFDGGNNAFNNIYLNNLQRGKSVDNVNTTSSNLNSQRGNSFEGANATLNNKFLNNSQRAHGHEGVNNSSTTINQQRGHGHEGVNNSSTTINQQRGHGHDTSGNINQQRTHGHNTSGGIGSNFFEGANGIFQNNPQRPNVHENTSGNSNKLFEGANGIFQNNPQRPNVHENTSGNSNKLFEGANGIFQNNPQRPNVHENTSGNSNKLFEGANGIFQNNPQRPNVHENTNSIGSNIFSNPSQRNSFPSSSNSSNTSQKNQRRATASKSNIITKPSTPIKENNCSSDAKTDQDIPCRRSPKEDIIESHRDFFASDQPLVFQAETQAIDTVETTAMPEELEKFLRVNNLEIISSVNSDYLSRIEDLCEIIDHIAGLNPSEDALNKRALVEMQKKYPDFPFLNLYEFKEYFDKYESLNYTAFIEKSVDIFKEMKKTNKDAVIHLSSDEMDS